MNDTNNNNTENNNPKAEEGSCNILNCNCSGYVPNPKQEEVCLTCSHSHKDHSKVLG